MPQKVVLVDVNNIMALPSKSQLAIWGLTQILRRPTTARVHGPMKLASVVNGDNMMIKT